MYYGRRYLRLALAASVVSVILLVIFVLASKKYSFDAFGDYNSSQLVNPTFNSKTKGSSFLSKISSLYSKDGDKQMLIDKFPLDASLTDNALYSGMKMKTYSDPAPYLLGKPTDFEITEEDICKRLEYESEFEVSKQMYLHADYEKVQKSLKASLEYSKLIEQANEQFKPTIPEEHRWFRFGGASVWLPQYELHYMVSRVLYTPSGIPNKSFVSFLYIQLFDKNWVEMEETTLTVPYEKKIMKSVTNADGSVTEALLETKLGSREITYPSLLPISFDVQMQVPSGKYYFGPEDPRILLRKNSLGFEEPLIVFNMKNNELVKRLMYLYLPFSNHLQYLKKRSEPYAYVEKNWTPFISTATPEKINFIYSIDPLEVLTCDVQTATCDFLQKALKEDFDYVGPLRGGTQLVHLPFDDLMPDHILDKFKLPKNRKIYIGWARAHLNKCGCGESMYRPNFVILVEDFNPEENRFYYKLSDVSEYVDFNAHVPPWTTPKLDENGNLIEDTSVNDCDGRNVLIPNSIAYWEIESVVKDTTLYLRKFFERIPTDEEIIDSRAHKVAKYTPRDTAAVHLSFNDYMGVTLSAADSDVSIVHIRGLLNYILHLPSLFDESSMVMGISKFQPRGHDMNNKCAMSASRRYCISYAENHGGVTNY